MSNLNPTGGLDRIPRWWPIIMAFVIVMVAGVRVQASVESMAARVDRVEAVNGDVRERLARIEATQTDTLRSVRRIEEAVDARPSP